MIQHFNLIVLRINTNSNRQTNVVFSISPYLYLSPSSPFLLLSFSLLLLLSVTPFYPFLFPPLPFFLSSPYFPFFLSIFLPFFTLPFILTLISPAHFFPPFLLQSDSLLCIPSLLLSLPSLPFLTYFPCQKLLG